MTAASLWGVNAVEHPEEDRNEEVHGTLGDLLYARKAPPRSTEIDWVALVRAIGARDQRAFAELYQRTNRIAFTLIMRIVGDKCSAEEVTLDLFHDVWRRASEYEIRGGTVLGWILNQARSRAIDRIRYERRKKRTNPSADAAVADCVDGCEESVDLEQRSRLLRRAVAGLQPAERIAIERAFFGELTYVEVASQLAEPVGTVKTRIRTGLQKLRFALWNGVARR